MNLIRKAGFLLVCATMVAAGNGTAQNVQRTSQGIKCATQGMDVNVEFYSPSIVRVYKTPSQKSCNKESLVIVKTPESTPVSFGEKGKNVTLSSRLIQVEVNPRLVVSIFSIRRATSVDGQGLRNTIHSFQ